MEVNYMLSYGSAESSLRLLWKLGLLEILLPIQVLFYIHLFENLYSFLMIKSHRHRLLTLFGKVFEGAMSGLICYWYKFIISRILIIYEIFKSYF